MLAAKSCQPYLNLLNAENSSLQLAPFRSASLLHTHKTMLFLPIGKKDADEQ
jgi:hypothetical protein